MLKFTRFSSSLTRTVRYTFIPPSCYDLQVKPNPVVCVTLGNDQGAVCDLHFRVTIRLLLSCSRMLYPKLPKISNSSFSEPPITKVAPYH